MEAGSVPALPSAESVEAGLDSEDKPPEEAVSFHHLTCTNENPKACAICSGAFASRPAITTCCGSRYCESCQDQSSQSRYDENSDELCALCRRKVPNTDREKFRMLLAAARRGVAWAQFHVGCAFGNGHGVDQSHSEEVYWLKKAAEQGHPHALVYLGSRYRDGQGCIADSSEAERYYRMAADLHQDYHKREKYYGVNNLASLIAGNGRGEEARDLLLPLAAEGNAEIQDSLGVVYHNNFSDLEEASKWFRSAATQGHSRAAQNLVVLYMDLGRHGLAKFWISVLMKIGKGVREGTLVDNMKALRRDEEHCGACAKTLGTPKQNMCKQCRTYCYCNRLCQIRHWNRGHRGDCKEVGELNEKMEELLVLFKNEPDAWFEQ